MNGQVISAYSGCSADDVRAAHAADGQERQAHLGRPELGQDGGAAALGHLDRARLGGPAVGRGQPEILLEADVTLLETAHRPGRHQQVHVDAVRRPDQVQPAAALPDQLADQGHRQPGGQAAAQRDRGPVADQGHRVGQADPLVAGRLQAHRDPPTVLGDGLARDPLALIAAVSTGS